MAAIRHETHETFERDDPAPYALPDIQAMDTSDAKLERLAQRAQASQNTPPLLTQFWLAVVQDPTFEKVLVDTIMATVKRPAQIQSLKGLYTAGWRRSLRYLFSKMTKYREGRHKARS